MIEATTPAAIARSGFGALLVGCLIAAWVLLLQRYGGRYRRSEWAKAWNWTIVGIFWVGGLVALVIAAFKAL